jgi:hypothetical protein
MDIFSNLAESSNTFKADLLKILNVKRLSNEKVNLFDSIMSNCARPFGCRPIYYSAISNGICECLIVDGNE